MKLFRKTALFLFILAFTVLSADAQKLEKYIPKDATFVVSMDLGNLDEKISFEKLQQYDFYKDMMKEMEKGMARDKNKELAQIMKNPSEYGVDVMKKSFMFGKMTKESSLFGFIFNISDHSKFTKFFKDNVVPEAKDAVMGKMGKFQTLTSKEGTFAWNKDMGLLVGGEINGVMNADEGITRESLVADFTKSVLEAKKGNSILRDARYMKATKGRKSDMRMWMDYEWVLEMQMKGSEMSSMGMGGMVDVMKKLYKDTDYMVELNFNDGAVVMDSKMYSNKETMERMRKMTEGELNKNFFKYLPKDNLLGYFSLAMNTANMADGLYEMFDPMIKDMGMSRDQMETMALAQINAMGIELDKKGLYELIKGDMIFAVTGLREFTVKKTQYDEDFNKIEVEAQQKLPEFAMMMSYGQENALNKMIQMGVDAGALVKKGNNAFKVAIPIPDVPMDMYLAKKDGIFFITNNADLADGKLSNGYAKSSRVTNEQKNMMKEHGGVFFWDIPRTLMAAEDYAKSEGMNDKMASKMINVSKESLESMVVTTEKDMKDSYSSEFRLNFINKRTNSLEQLFNYMNEVYLTAMNSGGM